MPGQVEGDDTKPLQDLAVVEQRPVLAAVGTGRVQAQQRYALAGLLDIEPVGLAADGEVQIAADDGFEPGLAHPALPTLERGSASRSLK